MNQEKRHYREERSRVIQAGRDARDRGESRESCPYRMILGQLEMRGWWMAGWHDRDQELDVRRATA